MRRIKEYLREKEKKNTASVNDRYIAFRALLFAFERSDFYATRADRERERERENSRSDCVKNLHRDNRPKFLADHLKKNAANTRREMDDDVQKQHTRSKRSLRAPA